MPTPKFNPLRGVQQGIPLSPYLFFLCMEWLRHRIQSAISSSKWNPIRLSWTEPDLSHLLFADDLVIFSKENYQHVEILKEILEIIFADNLVIFSKVTVLIFEKLLCFSLKEWKMIIEII